MKSAIGCSTPMNRRLFLFLSLPPPLCIQDAGVCKACTRFSVSPRINRIRRIVGTYTITRRVLASCQTFALRRKGSFRHPSSPHPPLSTRNTYYLHAVTRGVTEACAHFCCASLFANCLRCKLVSGFLHFCSAFNFPSLLLPSRLRARVM